MPQSEEHLQILTYLGVTRAVVALTRAISSKPTATDGRCCLVRETSVTAALDAPIVPTSVIKGTGLDELKQALSGSSWRRRRRLEILANLGCRGSRLQPARNRHRRHRRSLAGLKRGQAAVLQPSGKNTRVRSLQSHNREVESAVPGTRTALNLPDVAHQPEQASAGARRGDVVTVLDLGAASDTLDVVLTKSARLREAKTGAARPLKDGTMAQIHHGSGHVAARIWLQGGEPLVPGESVLAELRCETPVFACAGDRFIVRDWSEQWTLCGGSSSIRR